MENGSSTSGSICVSAIDVGKGDCILLQAGDAAALIDTGYDKTSGNVLAFLREKGVAHLEFVIITHYDRDHIGGMRAIGETIAIDKVYLPNYSGADKHYRTLMDSLEQLGLATQSVSDELSLKLGEASLTVFPSTVRFVVDAKGDEGNDNDLSLVTTLVAGSDSYLFAGDLEEDGLAAYLNGAPGALGCFDILKMPCHGKKSSLTDEFLERVQPQIVIITDSEDDPADKKVLKLLKETGAAVYRTATSGTVRVASSGAGDYSIS